MEEFNNAAIIKLSTADNKSVITSLVVIMEYAREADDKDLDSNGGSGQRASKRLMMNISRPL